MTKMLKSLIALAVVANLSYSQSLEANWECVGAVVEYTYVARAMESLDDTLNGATHTVTGSWPSSANPLYTRALKSFAVGDSEINMVKDTITSGEQISGVGYKVTSSYSNGALIRG